MTPLRTQLIFIGTGVAIIIVGALAAYLIATKGEIAVDTATIQAPLIGLTSTAPGRLDAIYVNTGDTIAANQPVAEVGAQVITSKVAGLVVSVNDTIGALVGAGENVVTMIDPSQLRVVGRIDETKGLSQIQIGDPVTFTVDAFGAKSFTGVIDEIAPTSNQSGIVFNISSQRETQQFDIKARFDTSSYPLLKNGMSARLLIHTQ